MARQVYRLRCDSRNVWIHDWNYGAVRRRVRSRRLGCLGNRGRRMGSFIGVYVNGSRRPFAMSLDSWMTAKPGSFESAEVFAQTPFKSRQFLAVTTVVI